MPKLVGGLAALVALAGGILANVEPFTCLSRAALAFLLGWLFTQLWYVFFTIRVQPGNSTTEETMATGN
jgi:hypothetical protein